MRIAQLLVMSCCVPSIAARGRVIVGEQYGTQSHASIDAYTLAAQVALGVLVAALRS